MPQTDTSFKLLVSEFALDFATWLLDVDDADVRHVQPLNIELPAGALRIDTVFRVTLADGRVTLLHVEFQSRRSERPMPLRMLDYLSRLAQQEAGYLCSAVLYVGDGAGANDEGIHQLECPDGGLTLAWRYRVVRLWQMQAEELLGLGRPALLALIGQTRIEEPERVLPQVMATIQQTPDEEERIRLFAALTSLMRDEEVLEMTERLLEAIDHGLMMDTPFLRRIREEARVEARAEGRIEGLTEGLTTLRQSILDVLAARFDPSVTCYRRIEAQLETIADPKQLRSVLQAAIRATDVADFERALET
jgi:predicted transposase YdaD